MLQIVLLSITYCSANNFFAEGLDTDVSAFFSKLCLWSWGLIELKLVHTVNSPFSHILAFIPIFLVLTVPAVVNTVLVYIALTLHETIKKN